MSSFDRVSAISSPRDCDSNAVINCGALTINELQRKFNNQSSVQIVYMHFGITSSDINNINTSVSNGTVTKGGRVIVDGNVVANNAITAGMQNMPGSTAHTINGTTFYMRPPNVSFMSASLPAFVVMKDRSFDFAVIASCGNPVKATPVVKKKIVQKQQAAAVTPPPAVSQAQTQSQTVVVTKNVPVPVVTPTVTPAPTPAQQPQPAPKQIPNTGVGDVAGLGSFVSLVAAGAHTLYKRKFF
jgi:hypothetical protein